jgi:hypothetical protein
MLNYNSYKISYEQRNKRLTTKCTNREKRFLSADFADSTDLRTGLAATRGERYEPRIDTDKHGLREGLAAHAGGAEPRMNTD